MPDGASSIMEYGKIATSVITGVIKKQEEMAAAAKQKQDQINSEAKSTMQGETQYLGQGKGR